MSGKNGIGCVALIIIIAVFIISVFLTKTIIEADIPVWLKFFLLK